MTLTDLFTNIANAIRSKDGTTASIIANDFPDHILDIPSGGSELPLEIATGTFTLESDVSAYITGSGDYRFIIEHGMSVTPNAALIYPESNLVVTEDGYLTNSSFAVAFKMQNIGNVGRTYNSTGGVSGVSNYNTLVSDWNYVEFTSSQILFGSNSSGTILRAGCAYRWIAWVIPTNEE